MARAVRSGDDRAMEYEVGNIAYSGQYQQAPVPRKGGIIKREYWQDYIIPKTGKFPDMDFICVSADTAFTEKEENDPTGCTTWGVFTNQEDDMPKVMLLWAWRKHLPIHGVEQEPQGRTESEADYIRRCIPYWGIVEHINGADVVLIEGRASGLDFITYTAVPVTSVPVITLPGVLPRDSRHSGWRLSARHRPEIGKAY